MAKENDDIRDILDKQEKKKDINIAPIRVTWNRIYLVLFSLALYLLLTYMELL